MNNIRKYRVQWVTNNCCMNQQDFEELSAAELLIARLERDGATPKLIELKPRITVEQPAQREA